MAELEPGHPDELVQTLRNWLREAQSGKVKEARGMIECAQQEMEVGLRDYLGLYSWNNVEEREEEQKKK